MNRMEASWITERKRFALDSSMTSGEALFTDVLGPQLWMLLHEWLHQLNATHVMLACLVAAPTFADTITYDIVTVGNPGNAPDANTSGTYGSVAYSYQIGKYDVTIGQYAAFLNAADPNGTNPNGIYNLGLVSMQAGRQLGSRQSGHLVVLRAPAVLLVGRGRRRSRFSSRKWWGFTRRRPGDRPE